MTVNEFNCKVNLPKLFLGLNLIGWKFVKLPVFGWFAYSKDHDKVVNCFDLFSVEESAKLYQKITIEKPEYLDFNLRFSELTESRLSMSIIRTRGWLAFWKEAREQAQHGHIIWNNKQVRLSKLAEELGYPHLLSAGKVGLINETVLKKFTWLRVPSELKNKLVIPSFVTPDHIGALYTASISDLSTLTLLYKDGEAGWFGSLADKKLQPDFKAVAVEGGFTYSTYAESWMTNVVHMSHNLSLTLLLQIWSESQMTFAESPIVHLKKHHNPDDVKHHVKNFTVDKINRLEQALGLTLLSHWKNLREQEITIGQLSFRKRHNQYFLKKNGEITPFTNFTVETDRIEKQDGDFYRVGHIFHKDLVIPFRLPIKAFTNSRKLYQALNNVMLESGAGVPFVLSSHVFYLLDVVMLFNEETQIVLAAKK